MITQPIRPLVFVVGAGAGKDFGKSMPVGSELARNIEQQLGQEFKSGGSDGPIKSALMRSPSGLSGADENAANQIRRSIFAQPSIDDLLNEWRDVPAVLRVGKLAITNAVLIAERESILGITAKGNVDLAHDAISSLRTSWLATLLRNLRSGISRRNIQDVFEQVAFITFNYDRCIEQYLYWAFQSVAGLSPGNAKIAISRIPIVHVYGDLGRLPYHAAESLDVSFGSEVIIHERVFNRIKTYTEEDHDEQHLLRIRTLVQNAKRLVFLGTSYHQRNMTLLFSGQNPRSDCEVWGTSLSPDQARLQTSQQLFEASGIQRRAQLENLDCASFLNNFRDALLSDL